MNALSQFSMAGKVAIVTGSSRGIGRAIAEALAAAGASVTVSARNAELAETVAVGIAAAGGASLSVSADVTRAADVERLVKATVQKFGRLDVLVNNAGISPFYKKAEELSESEWDQVIEVNLKGTFLCSTAAGRVMIPQKSGRIVNISSVAGRVALPNLLAYCAAKGGVEQITRVLAAEWAPHNIRVNSIAPGYIETDLTSGLRRNPKLQEAVIRQTPLGRLGNVDEITGAVIYLASDAASYVTGQTLYIDGGWTAI
jgi:NAD(P)-dependent dehydrogenase (short-subunit alcohol dehydrogenase family)